MPTKSRVHLHHEPPKNAAAQALGRLGGAAGTSAQQRAREANSQLGGQPGRVCVFCGEPVIGGHDDRDLDESCGAHGWRWKRKHDPPAARREALERDLALHQAAVASIKRRLAGLPGRPPRLTSASVSSSA